MDEEENKSLEEIKSHLKLTPELAFFRKHYWGKRNEIFNELYTILYDQDYPSKETDKVNDQLKNFDDSFSDVSNFDQRYLKHFENAECLSNKNDNEKKYENLNIESTGKKEDDEGENVIEYEFDVNIKKNFHYEDKNIINSRKMIYENYLKNYRSGKKKFSNNDFSLSVNLNKEIFFQINNMDIFEINYLRKIKINDYKEEWVCNAYYGCYLLYKIIKCKKPYPIYPKNNSKEPEDNNETKTISNENDFDDAISKGVNKIEDYNLQIDLDIIIENVKELCNMKLLKNSDFKELLNLNDQVPIKGDFKFLSYLFAKKNFLEQFTYIFGSKYYMSTEMILENLINIYKRNTGRFLYLDLEYIYNLKYRKDLKKYLAFWLIRAFFDEDYNDYKTFYNNIIESIDFGNIEYLIKNLLEFIRNKFKAEKLFIVINNANNLKAHNTIDAIRKITEGEGYHYNLLIFCHFENEMNFTKFFEIYKNQDIKLILIPDLIFDKEISDAKKEINDLFKEYNVIKFTDLIKIFHFNSFLSYESEKIERDFSEIDLIRKYVKFLKLNIENSYDENQPIIKGIKFKNDIIAESFLYQYNNYFLNLLESDEKLQEVLNLSDGNFFEKLIILDIITDKIIKNSNYNFIKLEVNSLFGLMLNNVNLEEYKGKNIIFTQKSKTAEIFDFGILINQNGELFMKLYQISTKKSKDDLAKLDVDIIKLHCININKNLKELGDIKNFSFGIITSFKRYEKNKNDYQLMKDDCKRKNFEFLIYNIIEKKFYVEEDCNNDNKKVSISVLENIFSINDKNKFDLPNYDSLFNLNPKFISMKYINSDYKHCIEKYLDKDGKDTDVKIIGKILYNQNLINSSITDNNIGLLISGLRPEESYTEEKNIKTGKKEIIHYRKDIKVKIMKEKEKNKIYEKDSETGEIKEIDEFKNNLFNPHILLYKYNEKYFIGRKRIPRRLFEDEVIRKKIK